MKKNAFLKEISADPVKTYCAIAGAALLLSLLYTLISGRGTEVFDWLVLGTSNDWELADFFRHIGYASDLKNTYYVSRDACFPPLAYLFFHILYMLNPLPKEISADNWQAYAMYPYEILLLVFCMIIAGILFYEIIRISLGKQALVLTMLLVLSAPVFIAIERGNPIFGVTVMLLWSLYLREQPEKWKRELALILIAVAAGFKIYPAILGLLYIKEKRFSETKRLLVYGILLFFVPFVFTGGIQGFRQFLDVLLHGHYNADFMKEWSSVRGLCRSVFGKIGMSDATSVALGTAAENIFLLLSVLLAFTTGSSWKSVLFLSAAMTFYMPTSWCYNMVFYLLPLMLYFRTKGEHVLYTVLFSAIFSIPVWGLYVGITKMICLPGYLLWIIAAASEIRAFISVRFRQDPV